MSFMAFDDAGVEVRRKDIVMVSYQSPAISSMDHTLPSVSCAGFLLAQEDQRPHPALSIHLGDLVIEQSKQKIREQLPYL